MTTLALEYFRSAPRFVGARTVGTKMPGLLSGPLAPLRLVSLKDPEPPSRPRGLGAREAAPVGDLRQRPVDDRGPLQLLLLAARVDAVRPRARDRRRAARRLRRPARGHPRRAWAASFRAPPAAKSSSCPNCEAGDTNLCDRVAVGDLKPGLQTGYCARPGAGGPACWWPIGPSCTRCPTACRTRSRCCSSRSRARCTRPARAKSTPGDTVLRDRCRHRRHPDPDRAQALLATRTRDRRGQAPEAARGGEAGGRRRDRPPRARGQGRPPSHERGQADARARAGLPVRRGRRRGRVHRVQERARPGAAHHAGGRSRRRLGHPGAGRRPDPAVVPRARTRRRLHGDDGGLRHRDPGGDQPAPSGALVGATYPLANWRDAIDHAMSAGSLGTFKVAFRPQD